MLIFSGQNVNNQPQSPEESPGQESDPVGDQNNDQNESEEIIHDSSETQNDDSIAEEIPIIDNQPNELESHDVNGRKINFLSLFG